jgi:hypothetical protein
MFRVGDDARTTKDLDLSRHGHLDAATDDMMTLESLDLRATGTRHYVSLRVVG